MTARLRCCSLSRCPRQRPAHAAATVREALARAGVPDSAAAVVVEPGEGGPRLLAARADAPMNPASVMKLVTTLRGAGPARSRVHVPHRRPARRASSPTACSHGDLVIRGGGDPKLTYERLWQLAHQLRARGLREVRGDVILDRGYFAPAPYDPARFDDEPRRGYNVGPDALLVNFKAVDFRFIPDADGVRVTASRTCPTSRSRAACAPSKEPCGGWRQEPAVRRRGRTASLATRGASRGPTRATAASKHLAARALRRASATSSRSCAGCGREAGGATHRQGARRARRPPARGSSSPRVRAAREPRARHEQVLQQRDGAAPLPRALGRAPRRRRARRRRASASCASGSRRRESTRRARDRERLGALARRRASAPRTLARVASQRVGEPVHAGARSSSLPVFAIDGTFKEAPRRGARRAARTSRAARSPACRASPATCSTQQGRRWIVVMMVNHANANAAQPALDALVDG